MDLIKLRNLFLIFTFLFVSLVQAQEDKHEAHEDHQKGHSDESHKKHSISASINHTVIFSGVKDGETKSYINVPSFGLNYTYFFNHKWAIGLHNDIILEDFLVQSYSDDHSSRSSNGESVVIERGRPVAMAVMAVFKPIPNLGIMAGGGMEFSSHEDFALIRIGLEAPIHLPKHWEVFGVLTYDIMIDAYSSLTYGIGFAKLF